MRPAIQLLAAILAAATVLVLATAIATLMMGSGCVHKNAFQHQLESQGRSTTGFIRPLPMTASGGH